ncbi:uncharacterized protein LOC115673754 [Syzygium oleosum]|uniref:uncharacterized protein LOC115673754 n=1 Tax=Syzygium oleosum TaxID=219896 RepID=UPI0024BB4EBE|nr:uncharacterized protein LOC115673754 [Syzygium oleosum]XP_056170241.1 uncharacterized protein LOC115673754 [Syzygium oleosum]XP_056170242.1 uncharacterized protein LOC115673754 [Syzygium oleosum]XP_056170244.1 uncharacterized protein LOC115673754 [Syzygium oleosum]
MDNLELRDSELEIDLESGGATGEEDGSKELASVKNSRKHKCLKRSLGGSLSIDRSIKSEPERSVELCSTSSVGEVSNENLEVLVDRKSRESSQEHVPFSDKKYVNEKRPTTNSRKPPKPPRPPKGPALDAADQKFVKDIAEVATRKRTRIERIKALRKNKAANASASSSSSSLTAMIITLLVFVIIVFQGMRSKSRVGFQDSPEPALTTNEELMSVQHNKNLASHFGRRARF